MWGKQRSCSRASEQRVAPGDVGEAEELLYYSKCAVERMCGKQRSWSCAAEFKATTAKFKSTAAEIKGHCLERGSSLERGSNHFPRLPGALRHANMRAYSACSLLI